MMGQGTEEQAPPQGGLGFLVYGLARSGTSATAKYLSAVPGVHCGNEVFPTFLDHASLRVPQAFLSHPDPFWSAGSVDEVRARQSEITVYGNKTPTYFYNLTRLYDALGPVPSVLCLRPLDQVAASYAMRAADPDDDWPDGRGALFACADALILLYALHQLEEGAGGHILALPQGALKTDWRAAMAQVLAHVAPGVPATYRDDDLRAIARRRDSSAARPKPQVEALAQVERDALGKLTSIGAAAFFANPRLGPVSARRDEIRAILAQAPSDPIDWMRRAVARHPNPQAEVFFQTWSRHVARVTQRIRARV